MFRTVLMDAIRSTFKAHSHRAKSLNRRRSKSGFASSRRRSLLEQLEDRRVLASFAVLNTFDSGVGSLRQAIVDANNNEGADIIQFDSAVIGTIALTSGKLTITDTVDLQGPGADVLAVSGSRSSRVFYVGANASISGLTITGGSSSEGGGIFNVGTLTLNNITVSGNSSSYGGGFYNSGTLTISNSSVSDNDSLYGGGFYNSGTLAVDSSSIAGNSASFHGGGINNYGTLAVRYSTISDNSALTYSGGGIVVWAGSVTISNSTLSGNRAGVGGGSSFGGAIYQTGGTLTVGNSTLSGNSASNGGGIGHDGGPLTINNSIIANNVATQLGTEDVPTTSFTGGNNLFGRVPLGPLQDNGGPTKTQAPFAGGPAIDAGNNALILDGVTTDQRGSGFSRIFNGTVDIGAFERQSLGYATTTSLTSAANPSFYGQSVTLTTTVSSAEGTPTGTVAYFDGSVLLGTATLASGVAQFTTSILTGGDHQIIAQYDGDTAFNSTSDALIQTVKKADQTFNFDSLRDGNYNGDPYFVSVTASSGLPVSLAVLSGPATLAGSSLTITGPGVVVLQASQTGNENYNAALTNHTFTVNRLTKTGMLDPTFGNAGKQSIDFTEFHEKVRLLQNEFGYYRHPPLPFNERATAVGVQPDGSILVVGEIDDVSFGIGVQTLLTSGGEVSYKDADYYGEPIFTPTATQADGKTLVVGSILVATGRDFLVQRYNLDGSLDTSFGNAGTATIDFGSFDDVATAVAVTPDGKIVVAGYSIQTSSGLGWVSYDFVVARLEGVDNPTVGTAGDDIISIEPGTQAGTLKVIVNGVTTDNLASNETTRVDGLGGNDAFTVTAAPTASLILNGGEGSDIYDISFGNLSGSVKVTDGGASGSDEMVVHGTPGDDVIFRNETKMTINLGDPVTETIDYWGIESVAVDGGGGNDTFTPINSLDHGFGAFGKTTTDFGGNEVVNGSHSVAVQADGKIVVVGSGIDFALARYNTDGSLDNTFGDAGIQTIDFGSSRDFGYGVALQSDGKIIVVGTAYQEATGYDFAVARLNSNGGLDNTFGTGGQQTIDFGSWTEFGQGVAVQADGKIVVQGYSFQEATGYDFAVARLNINGALDDTFGTSGKQTIDFGSSSDFGNGVAVQADGKIVVAGSSYQDATGTDFMVARLNSDGALDDAFGAGGKRTIDFGSSDDYGQDLVLQADGKIVVVGTSYQNPTGSDFALARLNNDGSLDTPFGTGGLLTINFATYDHGYGVALQADGKIVVVGDSYQDATGSDFAVARVTSDGRLDSAFGEGGLETIDFGSSSDNGPGVAVQADGKIVVAGSTWRFATGYDFVVARLLGFVDTDGVSDVVEDGAPNGGDGNRDGIPDSQQSEVTSLHNTADQQYVTLASPTGTTLSQVVAIQNPSPANSPAGIEFPFGHFTFTVQNVGAGNSTTVTLYLPDDALVNTYYKYGPTSDDPTPHWYEFLFDGLTGAEIFAGPDADSDPEIIILHFVDGQRGDDDLAPNGKVKDPGSPAFRPNQPPVAYAGGPYAVNEGGSVQLDGSASTDGDQSTNTLTFQWDLDDDGVFGETGASATFGDEIGINPTFSAATLVGASSHAIHLRVFDNALASSEATTTVMVHGFPVISAIGPQDCSETALIIPVTAHDPEGGLLTYSVSFVSKTGAGAINAPTGFSIDAGGVFRWTPGGGQLGQYTFQVNIMDNYGLMTNATFVATTLGVVDGVLVIVGTDGADKIDVKPTLDDADDLTVKVNEKDYHYKLNRQNNPANPYSGITLIHVCGLGGDDQVNINNKISINAWLEGGAGNDQLHGGGGDDVVLGGLGNDKIFGDDGHDFIVGGLGDDKINGEKGHDILVSGDIAGSLDFAILRATSQAWADSHSVAEAELIDIALDEMLEDTVGDQLTGGVGADLFFVNTGDTITDFKFGKPKDNKDGDVVIKNGVMTI